MNTINKTYIAEQTINKSIFICQLFPIKDSDEAIKIIQATKKKYYEANHNCYSYIWGDNGEYAKNSDDGEPSQTAGIIIHDVLVKNNLTNVLAIVTRYFGGIKLGAGGLVRAYSSSTALALKEAIIIPIIKTLFIKMTFNYSHYNNVLKILSYYQAKEIDKVFQESVVVTYEINEEFFTDLQKKLIDITKNQIIIDF